MISTLQTIGEWFGSQNFMPHGHCYLWRPEILWLHVVSDAVTGLSYYSIPIVLLAYTFKKKDFHYKWVLVLFAVFILSCGSTHLFDIYTTWHPLYFTEGLLKAFTGISSLLTAVLLWPLLPKVLRIPGQAELNEKNRQLQKLTQDLEQKVAERTVDSARLAAIVNSSAEAIIAKSAEGVITDWNRAAQELYGYSSAEAVGQHIKLLFPPSLQETELPQIMHEVKSKGSYSLETVRRHKDGRALNVFITIFVIADQQGRTIGFSSISRDISRQKALEKELKRTNAELTEKRADMEQFVYSISHDLKSPLVTCMSFMRFLKEDLAEKKYQELNDSLEEIDTALNRIRRLIDDILELSQFGHLELEKSEVSLLEVVQEVVNGRFKHSQEVEFIIDPQLPTVWGDSDRLLQVFENLIINAVKYQHPERPPRVEIFSETSQKGVRVCVRDNGIGIDQKYYQKIFIMFQRLKNDGQGSGIGLTVVAKIMNLHGGRVWVSSTLERGSEFWLEFPEKPRTHRAG